MKYFLPLFLVLLFYSLPAAAGGDWVPVRVQKLTMLSDTDYVLVVLPAPKNTGLYKDLYFSDCEQFEVRGTLQRLFEKSTLRWLTWWKENGTPTKELHLAALTYLKKYEGTKTYINFGWMGMGFNIEGPCIVESRGLALLTGGVEGKDLGVFSFFNSL
jgi:hypothetical protein